MGRSGNSSYPTARTWFDEFIISKEPIADPHEAVTATGDPRGESMRDAGERDIRTEAAGSRITFTFADAGEHQSLRIFDRRGRLVHAFSGRVAGSAVWGASLVPNGIYGISAQSGTRTLTRAFSLLR